MKPRLTDEQIEKMALEEHPIDGRMSTLAKRYSFKKGARHAREIYEGQITELETLCAEAMGEMPKEWRERFRKLINQ